MFLGSLTKPEMLQLFPILSSSQPLQKRIPILSSPVHLIINLSHSTICLQVLYQILFYASYNDPPYETFRVRMACALLEHTAPYFLDSVAARKKLLRFMPYFYRYVMTKNKPFPVDLDFAFAETLELLQSLLPASDVVSQVTLSGPCKALDTSMILRDEAYKRCRRSDPFGSWTPKVTQFLQRPGKPRKQGGIGEPGKKWGNFHLGDQHQLVRANVKNSFKST